jgi:hypothetical protein
MVVILSIRFTGVEQVEDPKSSMNVTPMDNRMAHRLR